MRAAGPLGRHVHDQGEEHHLRFGGRDGNAATLLRRVAWTGPGDMDGADEQLLKRAADRMYPTSLLQALTARRRAAVARLEDRGAFVAEVDIKPVDRLVIGLGGENPRENGFHLHGTYGVPVLPGSAIKGVVRAAGRDDDDSDQLPAVAGTPAGRGSVLFLDALPVASGADPVTVDVLTRHGREWEQPIPVKFLTVNHRLTFRVHVVGIGPFAEELVDLYARPWVERAVTDLGVGAKTSAGYGYMSVVEANP